VLPFERREAQGKGCESGIDRGALHGVSNGNQRRESKQPAQSGYAPSLVCERFPLALRWWQIPTTDCRSRGAAAIASVRPVVRV
jgi:hypothetical protein